MYIGIKGLTKLDTLPALLESGLTSFSFDLRPRSLNFTQSQNIIEILSHLVAETIETNLIFENEKDFVVNNVLDSIGRASGVIPGLEFTGSSALSELDKLEKAFKWHYTEDEKLSSIESCKNLETIVFSQSLLSTYAERGELHGFFQLFADLDKDMKYELLLSWDGEIIESVFDFIDVSGVSVEIQPMVELSYQNVDLQKVTSYINYLKKVINQ